MAKKTETKTPKVKTVAPKAEPNLIEKYRSHDTDTGSTEVQIALLSERIGSLATHLKDHRKDQDSRRGLLLMVGKRRRLLNYLRREQADRYQKLIADLGLRK